jgi:ribosome maturation factor RimP
MLPQRRPFKSFSQILGPTPCQLTFSGAFEGPFFLVDMERAVRNNLIHAIQSQVLTEGFECVEVDWLSADRVLRIFIDNPAGITLDQCAEITRKLQETELLDQFIEEDFDIEVSSPGLDRPLRCREHFERNLGQTVRVELTESSDGRKAGRGVLKALGLDGTAILETTRGEWRFGIDQIESANVEYQWPERGAKGRNLN